MEPRAMADLGCILVCMFQLQLGVPMDFDSRIATALLILLLAIFSEPPQPPRNLHYQLSHL